MSRRVFISFRYDDGYKYKEELSNIFSKTDTIINCSENQDRSYMSEETIKRYLYGRLKNTSVTIVLLTPEAVNHEKTFKGFGYEYDDWMYDEIKYSLDDRENNRCNGLIAVYTPEAKKMVIESTSNNEGTVVREFDNLIRKNMFNIKKRYKHNPKENSYNRDFDHYCSLISWETFINNYEHFIEVAAEKREKTEQYDIVKRLH